MSAMNELSLLLEDLIACGTKLTETAQALKKFYSSTEETAETSKEAVSDTTPEKKAVPAKTYSKEEVRAMLAAKAAEAEGKFKAEVKAIVRKYSNGGSLTNVDPADYPALVKEMESLNAG